MNYKTLYAKKRKFIALTNKKEIKNLEKLCAVSKVL